MSMFYLVRWMHHATLGAVNADHTQVRLFKGKPEMYTENPKITLTERHALALNLALITEGKAEAS